MAELARLISTRAHKRGSLTTYFNKRHSFAELTNEQRLELKLKLQNLSSKIGILNEQIQTLLYKPDDPVSFESELESCHEYDDKLCVSIGLLSEQTSVLSDHAPLAEGAAARSILKSPTAPLPFFKGSEEEDLTRFIAQFEATISKFRYSHI